MRCLTKPSINSVSIPLQILIIGPLPPPVGGISVHVQRLAEYLRSEGHYVKILDYTGTPRKDVENVITMPEGRFK